MKPIIIEIKDKKIVMDVNEFKKHIEDAYQQGYQDGSSISTTADSPYWWRYLTCNPDVLNPCAGSSTSVTLTGDSGTVITKL